MRRCVWSSNLVNEEALDHWGLRRQIKKILDYEWEDDINTLRMGETNLHFYITTVQDGWRKSAF